jgi:hypothetical protein
MTSRKRWSKSVFILSLLLAATWTANAADAANTVENFRLKGNTATALFQAADPLDPCLENVASVVASDTIEKVLPGGRTAALSTVLAVIQRDVCTDFLLFSGVGDTADSTLEVASDLSSATLTATVPVLDTLSHQTFPFHVNLVWQATRKGVFQNTKETFKDKDLGIMITTFTRSRQAPATATETVFGDGQNFTPEASDDATIQKENDGTHFVEKMP